MTASVAERRSMVYLSAVPIGTYSQRPHFLAQACLDAGFDEVLWVEPYPTRLPQVADIRRQRMPASAQSPSALPAAVRALRVPALPIEPLPGGAMVNQALLWRGVRSEILRFVDRRPGTVIGVGKPSALAEWLVDARPHQRSFFDVLDNYPEFHQGRSRAATAERFARLLARCTDVYCSSTSLLRMLAPRRPDAVRILNGYASAALPPPSPLSMRDCIGYVGTIGRWFDWGLVVEIAHALPEVPLVLVGPEFIDRPSDLPANIALVGEVPQAQIAPYLARFRAGLIPFLLNDLTDKVDPIKYYEYGCMGIPCWSTPFGEMQPRGRADGVEQVASGIDWRALWARASQADASPDAIAHFRHACAWEQRFAPMLQHLLGAPAQRPVPALDPVAP